MTITILKLQPGQKIARPFSRATDRDEAAQILANFEALNTGPERGRFARAIIAAALIGTVLTLAACGEKITRGLGFGALMIITAAQQFDR